MNINENKQTIINSVTKNELYQVTEFPSFELSELCFRMPDGKLYQFSAVQRNVGLLTATGYPDKQPKNVKERMHLPYSWEFMYILFTYPEINIILDREATNYWCGDYVNYGEALYCCPKKCSINNLEDHTKYTSAAVYLIEVVEAAQEKPNKKRKPLKTDDHDAA